MLSRRLHRLLTSTSRRPVHRLLLPTHRGFFHRHPLSCLRMTPQLYRPRRFSVYDDFVDAEMDRLMGSRMAELDRIFQHVFLGPKEKVSNGAQNAAGKDKAEKKTKEGKEAPKEAQAEEKEKEKDVEEVKAKDEEMEKQKEEDAPTQMYRNFHHVARATFAPSWSVDHKDSAVVVSAAVPGLAKKDVRVTVRGNELKVASAWKNEENENYPISPFVRRWRLADTVDTAGVTASHANGLLKVTVPFVQPTEPSEVDVAID